jgi:CheY-like chemotaxis protein
MEDIPYFDILVVDDNEASVQIIQGVLEKMGCNVDVVVSAEEVLVTLNIMPYHLIFFECHLPGITGLEISRLIRQSSEEYADMPIIGINADVIRYTKEKPGEQYALYFTNGGSVGLDLSDATGTFDVTWIIVYRWAYAPKQRPLWDTVV